MQHLVAEVAAMIRTDAIWMSIVPVDMRAGTDTLLARIVVVFGAAHPHHAYLFANARGTRMKVLVHDGIGVWLASRRLDQGRFTWAKEGDTVSLSRGQFDALVLGLPWQRVGADGVIRRL
jgi:transposase